MKHPLVEKLEKRLLPEFEKVAEKIRQDFPDIIVTIDSSSVGSLTQYQGHSFYIECYFPDASDDENDNVALGVSLGYLTTTPRIMADAGEANFKDWTGIFPNDGMILTDELLEELYQDLPRLYEALFEALRRRKPKDLC